jgi:hypothetical protein
MSDIVERIRSLRYVHVPVASQLFEEAAAEIERLRIQLRERGTAVRDNCVTGNQREMEYPQPTLTDEEREAVEFFADIHSDDEPPHEFSVTLSKLLKRLT